MLDQSEPRLNRLPLVGYYLDTQVDAWPRQRARIVQALQRRKDMDVSGLGSVPGSTPLRPATPAGPAAGANPTPANPSPLTPPQDELQISSASQIRDRLGETPEVRAERIAQIKEAIDNGEYDTDAKLNAALERLFEVHGIDLGDE